MKSLLIFLLILFLIAVTDVSAQNLNLSSLKENEKHIINLNTGAEYAMTLAIGYGYRLKATLPIVLDFEYSQPFGDKTFDDLKTRVGGQVRLLQYGNLHVTGRAHGVFRVYNNSMVRMVNFGSDFSAVIGYYRPRWYVAGEAGFDKAIVTHFKHSSIMREYYPGIKGGWYQPATGGNFYYGAQAGFSVGPADIYLHAGKILAEDLRGTPSFPFYGRVGISYKLRR